VVVVGGVGMPTGWGARGAKATCCSHSSSGGLGVPAKAAHHLLVVCSRGEVVARVGSAHQPPCQVGAAASAGPGGQMQPCPGAMPAM